jgi:hypothetical protein
MSTVIKDKLQNCEVVPPARVWEKIASELDESELASSFPSALYQAEVVPPLSVWNTIKESLEPAEEKTMERRRIIPWIRYAAAASVIGLMALGGFQLFKNKTSGNTETGKPITNAAPAISNPAVTPDNTLTKTGPATDEETRDDRALEESKHTFASLDMSANSRIRQKTRNAHTQPLELAAYSASSLSPEETYQELPCSDVEQPSVMHSDKRKNIVDRYVMLMTPDGNIIRVSKKWSDLVCCVSGAEQDSDCKDQLKKWREKVATSAPANVLDILSLVNSLQDNNH